MEQARTPLPAPQLAEASFFKEDGNKIPALTDEGLMRACGLRIAFTGRAGGVSKTPYDALNLGGHVDDDPQHVASNRNLLMGAMGVAPRSRSKCIVPVQVHGDDVSTVGEDLFEGSVHEHEADGVVCTRAGVPVILCFADCVSVVLAAPSGAFAVLHAGWRGALAGIPGKGAIELSRKTGFAPCECNAYIGPHIGPCCYETSSEILGRFVQRFGSSCNAGENHLDLTAAVTASLLEAGVDPQRIADAGICTSCSNDIYYSYRADGGVTGRHGAFAYLREEVAL